MPSPLREICRGRWAGLLVKLGMDKRFLDSRHGPCPICGGTDRFRFDDKDGFGSCFCTQCGATDGIGLVMRFKGWDFKEAAAELQQLAGTVEPELKLAKQNDRQIREMKNALWLSGKRASVGDPVDVYLKSRGIDVELPPTLRFVERCKYLEKGVGASWHPAMVAMVQSPDGKPATLHRTYLGDGCKADVPEPKKLMPLVRGGTRGAAVRLGPAGVVMGVSTGIETALSASMIWKVPVWAALSDAGLMAWEPPPECQKLVIFGDADRNFSGQAAAYALAHRVGGQPQKYPQIEEVSVECPDKPPADWNDVLQARRSG